MAAYFSRDALAFLTELRTHNNRDWFEKNKPRYEDGLREPMLRFIADLGPKLAKISPQFVADPKPVGGSMMRIYRDIRFSKDKTPYKTAIAAHFWHKKGTEGATPAFFLRLEPGSSVIGAGVWRPEGKALKQIRDRIVSDSKTWKKITEGREFKTTCGMAGESLKRPPPGYDAEHPFIEDLKRKDFATSAPLADAKLAGADFMDAVLAGFRTSAPLVEFLSEAVGLPF
jgi:uncharacterized protein (TIGR02453 family)